MVWMSSAKEHFLMHPMHWGAVLSFFALIAFSYALHSWCKYPGILIMAVVAFPITSRFIIWNTHSYRS
jgi:uncharacterized membrane protein YdbT with pleckstrin-like domain